MCRCCAYAGGKAVVSLTYTHLVRRCCACVQMKKAGVSMLVDPVNPSHTGTVMVSFWLASQGSRHTRIRTCSRLTPTQAHACTHTHSRTHPHRHTHRHMHAHTHTHSRTHPHRYTHRHMHAHTHAHTHSRTHTGTHTHRHTCVHTNHMRTHQSHAYT